jgi:predicted unusual protein kinase regulating ubiquinone biosynthesis (AarF/ABC1/UbiB family)
LHLRDARAEAAVLDIFDYKWTFWKTYVSEEERRDAMSACHTRSAQRVLKALLANGGVFIKLGQHMASLCVYLSFNAALILSCYAGLCFRLNGRR